MNLSSAFRLVTAVLLVLGLSGCTQEWSWHQRLTLVVDTPSGMISASSVTRRNLRFTDGWFVPPQARGAASSYSGEAVAIAVPQVSMMVLRTTPQRRPAMAQF